MPTPYPDPLSVPRSSAAGVDCPSCGAARRGRTDRRKPASLTPDGKRWRCWACDSSGSIQAAQRQTPAAPRGAPSPRDPQPWARLSAVWASSAPLTSAVSEDLDYLKVRGLTPLLRSIQRLDLARLSPPPAHACFEHCRHLWPRLWARTWRLLIQAFDATGRPWSMHARAMRPTTQGKTRWPRNAAARGLLFANPTARGLMRGTLRPKRLCICEGATDWLAASASLAEAGALDTAVVGGTSGGFAALASINIPADCTVLACLDNDATGQRYLQDVRRALASRPVHVLSARHWTQDV